MEISDVDENTLQLPKANVARSVSSASGTSGAAKRIAAASSPRQRLIRSNSISALPNKGAAGDIEQHVIKDERDKPLVTADVRLQENSKVTPEEVKDRRSKLRNMFGTPCEKWKTRRKFPFKLTLQLLKVVIVTLQLVCYVGERATFDDFLKTNTDTFRHLFLKGDLNENGADEVHTPEDLYEHINHLIYQYYRFDEISLSGRLTHAKSATIKMNITYFEKLARIAPGSKNFQVDPSDDSEDYVIPDIKSQNCTEADPFDCYDIKGYLDRRNQSLDLQRLIEFDLVMYLGGIYVKVTEDSIDQPIDDVECVDFRITTTYENKHSGGQMKISLDSQLDVSHCEDKALVTEPARRHNSASKGFLTALDAFVIIVCLASLVLTTRTIIKRESARKETQALFNEHYGYTLSFSERLEFISLWYLFYIVSDVFVVIASSLKFYIRYGAITQSKTYTNEIFYDATGILFGVAIICEWISLIRYLGYSSQYYVLILTINCALPELVRFSVCNFAIFIGFVFAGYVVLGPYDEKFETIWGSAEGLFSLMHGDEVYNTMQVIDSDNHHVTIWLTAQIFHYTYCTLFIFANVNLFIAVIMDSYERVKEWKVNGMPKSFLHHFTDGTLNELSSDEPAPAAVYHSRDKDGCVGIFAPLLCCFNCDRKAGEVDDQYEEKEEEDTTEDLGSEDNPPASATKPRLFKRNGAIDNSGFTSM